MKKKSENTHMYCEDYRLYSKSYTETPILCRMTPTEILKHHNSQCSNVFLFITTNSLGKILINDWDVVVIDEAQEQLQKIH